MLVGSSSCRVEFLVEADEYTSTPWKPYFLRSRESYGIVFGKKRIIPKNFAFAEYVRSQPCLACLASFDLASTTLFLPSHILGIVHCFRVDTIDSAERFTKIRADAT
jgi:hypothetical protein